MDVNHNARISHLPGSYGLPLIGRNISLLKDPISLFREQYQKYGSISKTSIGGYKAVVLIGPDHMKTIMLDSEQNYSAKGGWGSTMPDLFAGSVLVRDFEEHRIHRRIMQSAFKTDTLKLYMPEINDIVAQSVSRWANSSEVLYFGEIKRLLLEIAFRIFCYVDESEAEREQVNKAFTDMMEGALGYIRFDCPGFLYHRAMKGRRFLEKYFMEKITFKRKNDHKDAFTYFCNERKENGEYFSDKEIADHMVFLMLAAHDTTASAITMAAYYLANDAKLQDRLASESVCVSSKLTLENIRKNLPGLEAVFHEILRLHPAVSIFFRSTLRDVYIDGEFIPANTLLVVPTMFNHRLERWWKNAEDFNPERFSDSIQEHKQHAFQWTPFGGGAHKCIGLNFADILFKATYQVVLKDYRIEYAKEEYYPAAVQHFPFAKPIDDLPLRLRRR